MKVVTVRPVINGTVISLNEYPLKTTFLTKLYTIGILPKYTEVMFDVVRLHPDIPHLERTGPTRKKRELIESFYR